MLDWDGELQATKEIHARTKIDIDHVFFRTSRIFKHYEINERAFETQYLRLLGSGFEGRDSQGVPSKSDSFRNSRPPLGNLFFSRFFDLGFAIGTHNIPA